MTTMVVMHPDAELSDFLRSRRARLSPADVGLPDYGDRRRVAGLRRAELARIAGVSEPYYTRLEQGRAGGVSSEVLASLAAALRLDPDEVRYLRVLVDRQARRRPAPGRGGVRTSMVSLLSAMQDVPGVVLNRYCDVVAANGLGRALLLPHVGPDGGEGDPTNMARAVFQDDRIRDLYPDWEAKARETVAFLRLAGASHPDDRRLAALIGELTIASREFASMWSAHLVADKGHGSRRFRHPQVGDLTLAYETLRFGDDNHVLVLFHATDAGSRGALQLLGSWVFTVGTQDTSSTTTSLGRST